MAAEDCWASFFDPDVAMALLAGAADAPGNVVECGCGYGAFTIPVARRASGLLTALDTEAEAVVACAPALPAARIEAHAARTPGQRGLL
jgi:trans-aconitate methyltransferase